MVRLVSLLLENLQLAHDVSNDFSVVLSSKGQVWPVQDVVVVILEAVVLWKAPQVGVLEGSHILHLNALELIRYG